MRRVRNSLIILALPLALVAAVSCGVTADTSAATVAGSQVDSDTVDALARDDAFLSLLQISCDSATTPPKDQDESVVSGCAARGALSFEIERTAWVAESARLGAPVDAAARAAATEQLDGDSSIEAVSKATRSVLVDYLAGQAQVQSRFASMDPGSDSDLRLLYDGIPNYWERACFTGLAVPAAQRSDVAAALRSGTALEAVPEAVAEAQIIAESSTDCIPLSSLPPELSEAVAAVPTGTVTKGVVLPTSSGADAVYFLRVDSMKRVGFEDAKPELSSLLGQLAEDPSPWIQLVIQDAEINPRYGSGMVADSQGRFAVAAPPVPILSISDRRAAAKDAAAAAAAAAAQSSATAGSGSAGSGTTGSGTAGTADSGATTGSAGSAPTP